MAADDAVSAEDARRLGMVTDVVALDELEGYTLSLAGRIAQRPSMGLKLAKQAVNQALDAQGQWTAIQGAFSLHEVGYAHNMVLHGSPVDPTGAQVIREGARRR